MRILFVCSGNTCRSPTAEALMRREAAARHLEGVLVASAGTGAVDGAPASEGAYLVGLEHGLDLSGHRSRALTPELLRSADLVLTMGRSHLGAVRAMGAGDRAHLLGDFADGRTGANDVSDPFGADLDQYRRTYDELETLVVRVLDRLVAQPPGDQR